MWHDAWLFMMVIVVLDLKLDSIPHMLVFIVAWLELDFFNAEI